MAPDDHDDDDDGGGGDGDGGDRDELTTGERRALDTLPVVEPPAGFADRVIAAQAQRPAVVTPRVRRWPIVMASLAGVGVIALVVAVTRGGGEAADGALSVNERTTAELGHRATIVAEANAVVRWHVASSGAAEIDQTAGDVFYRVERGGPFVVHTPAGDVRVTGTCLRIEVIPMKPTREMLISGVVGAALATAVVITVYEGHVIAEGRNSHTDVVAGAKTTMSSDSPGGVTAAQLAVQRVEEPALATATREQLVALAEARGDQISRLKAKLDEIEKEAKGMHGERAPHGDEPEEGRPWHDPSHERLVEWAAQCKIAFDEPDIERFTPFKSASDARGRGLQANELDAYNATLGDQQKQWTALVRALYIEATGDAAGADTLSIGAMQNEIRTKSTPSESGLLIQKLSRERAGLQPVATDTSKMSPLERLYRAELALGDQVEQALGKRVGAQRASQIRGNSWLGRSSISGCPGE